jgi:hypothetical protein
MPDITMCASKECPVRKKCYRATAKPSQRQSMADFYNKNEENCGYFTGTFLKEWRSLYQSKSGEDEGTTYDEALVEMGYTLKKEPK